ncbi:MAG TPA: PDZ domain-containing protein [Candidatus Sulfotelmatobacter sp.]|nr:PDZ domain-containing protein [Candidatus Sulfotelmatobacter sp.]
MRPNYLFFCVVALWTASGFAASAATNQTAAGSACGMDARMLRYPDVSATQITFVYAGDIWVAPKSGGLAQRLSSPKGEEIFPRFSPDGSQIAFSGNYDGNTDIYVVPATGGLPKRLTYHGDPDRMLEWYPDGKSILFATSRTSEKDRFNQLYKIGATGGLPEKLPVPYGEFGAISPDGKTLAYIPISVDFRTWKRYRGGMNSAIWLFNLETGAAKDLTGNEAANSQPMWHGSTLYFLSDRDKNKRANLWAYDTKKDKFRQITTFEEFDVHFPNVGPEDIVFENGGRLYLLSLATEKYCEVSVQVLTDRATLKPRLEDVSKAVREPDISPSGKRAVFEARGDLFTVPAEHGVVRNLTRSSGVAERFPSWSPDGKSIAYFSDRSGEYELTLRPADGTGAEQVLTKLGPGYRYRPFWSPDSKKLVFIDQAMRMYLHDLDKKQTKPIGKQLWLYHGDLSRFKFSWSKDSRWLAYPQDLQNEHTAIALYDTKESKQHLVTSGYYEDTEPVFDPDGKYLYYRSGREFAPIYSDLDDTWIYPNTYQLVAVPLRKDVASPLAPRNDDEGDKDKKDKEKEKKQSDDPDRKKDEPQLAEKKEDSNKDEAKADETSEKKDKKSEEGEEKKDTKGAKPLIIDLAEFERRAVVLPPKPGYFGDLAAVSGKLIYRRLPRAGASDDNSKLVFYDLEKREDKTILDEVDDMVLAAKGEKMLVRRKSDYAIIEPKEGQKFDKKLAPSAMETVIDPVAEWRQIFTEAWRLERDYFYDPNLHGVDWKAMRQRYGDLLKDAVTRWDVNYVIGELISELNSSHTYRNGGDTENSAQRGVGYLGVDFALENGAYRIKRIIDGAVWDAEDRSPLKRPGVDVNEGDYLLAVNGLPMDTEQEPYAAFQGLADKPVFLTVNSKATLEGAREVLVQTLASEARLRHLAWIEKNRKKVEEVTGGQVGYVYVPDTGRHGQNELVRQFRAQFNKAGLIIDERFNSGGQIPDRFIELLSRKTLNYWGVRDGQDWSWPRVAHSGPQAMLVNGWSGSGGDCFPFYFQKAHLGPVIGTRTWGGLIGITGAPGLIDGGSVTVPTFGIYNTKGEWIIEGHGVDPDITVVDDPSLMAKGGDPQLERAIEEVLKALKKAPTPEVKKPKYPLRAGR